VQCGQLNAGELYAGGVIKALEFIYKTSGVALGSIKKV
jgi:hypothetical protein